MEVKNFRIGNIVNETIKITEIDSLGINGYYDEGIGGMNYSEYGCLEDEIEPIPITEEWLINFGFEKINHINGYSFYSLSKSKINKCHITIYDTRTEYMGYLVNHCEYVHQLQNLFFAITGKELELKHEFSKTKQQCTLHSFSGSTSGILVGCCDCEDKHYKHQRITRKQGAWETYHCPKCGSESFYRL